MSRQLPARPNLDHLKHQAKDLLGELTRTNPGAKLADALHAVAQDYGFTTWPELKAHVEALPPQESPFAGRWTADVSKSKRHPLNQYQSATLEFGVTGKTVTIRTFMVDEGGKIVRATQVVEADAKPHMFEGSDYAVFARLVGSHILEIATLKGGVEAGRVKYTITGDTLSLDASGRDHDGYGVSEQVAVFHRE